MQDAPEILGMPAIPQAPKRGGEITVVSFPLIGRLPPRARLAMTTNHDERHGRVETELLSAVCFTFAGELIAGSPRRGPVRERGANIVGTM